MTSFKININRLKFYPDNPRKWTQDNLDKLVISMITFFEKTYIDPIVINKGNFVLSGNMRKKCFSIISLMDLKEILSIAAKYSNDKSENRMKQIADFWDDFKRTKEVAVTCEDSLTIEQEKEYILKDNTHYGTWDFDTLANIYTEFDMDLLNINFDFVEAEKDYLGVDLSDLEPTNNAMANAANNSDYSITFTYPIEYKERFEMFDKNELSNILLRAVNANI